MYHFENFTGGTQPLPLKKVYSKKYQFNVSCLLPVFEVLGLDLGHLSAGEVKHFLAEQFEDDHVVLTEALTGPTRPHNITDEGGPVFGPFLLQDLQ